ESDEDGTVGGSICMAGRTNRTAPERASEGAKLRGRVRAANAARGHCLYAMFVPAAPHRPALQTTGWVRPPMQKTRGIFANFGSSHRGDESAMSVSVSLISAVSITHCSIDGRVANYALCGRGAGGPRTSRRISPEPGRSWTRQARRVVAG